VKSEVSIFRCVVFVSVSVVSLICAYKLGKDQRRTDAVRKSPQPRNNMIALKEGQTIVAVSDTTKAMCFYIGNDARDSSNDA
jgi:hypothetical protein